MVVKKNIGIILLISVLFLTGMVIPAVKKTDEIKLLENGFQSSGAIITEYTLHEGIPYKRITEDQLLAEGKKLSDIFQIPVGQVEQFGQEFFYVSKGTWNNNTQIEVQLKNMKERSSTYFVVNVTGNNSFQQLEKDYIQLVKMLQKSRINPKINSCIQGEISDKLNKVDQYHLIQEILKNTDSSIVEELKTDLVTSVSAYSDEIGQAIQTKGGSMNLQVATHYDVLHNKTILTMGTPIITIEY